MGRNVSIQEEMGNSQPKNMSKASEVLTYTLYLKCELGLARGPDDLRFTEETIFLNLTIVINSNITANTQFSHF